MENSCKTRYPLLLVHGTGARDRKHLNYWGRIPKKLAEEGAAVYYGGQDSWGTIEDNALVVRQSLMKALEDSGAEKVNILAHSKGGIEARYLASTLGCGDKIASITTVCTPHGGSKTMDKLVKTPAFLFRFAGAVANLWFRLLGDKKPRFCQTCMQFTTGFMAEFNRQNPDVPGIYYQSYAALMGRATSDMLMWLPYLVVKSIEGENDGLVTPGSARWGDFRGVWQGATNRGISHADEVDVRRMRFTKKVKDGSVSDITASYLEIVRELKENGC